VMPGCAHGPSTARLVRFAPRAGSMAAEAGCMINPSEAAE